ncbi:MAG: hypothetical protein KTR31_24825 [Myxococcales bacterium]|nr:hypothetical protein [Myxococcales bacterium]
MVLPEHIPFEGLRELLRASLPAQMAAIGGRTTRLDLGSRPIVLFDLRRLVGFLRQEFGVEITGLYVPAEAIHSFAERELKLKLFASATSDAQETDASAPIPSPPDSDDYTAIPAPSHDDGSVRTLPVHRTLRSGSQVRFDGDVHVYGDVNPGAHVVATGSILVFGALKGVAHAGAHGDEQSFILAFDMRPTQLRIARNIAIPPLRTAPNGIRPEVAVVAEEQVRIQPFTGRSPFN